MCVCVCVCVSDDGVAAAHVRTAHVQHQTQTHAAHASSHMHTDIPVRQASEHQEQLFRAPHALCHQSATDQPQPPHPSPLLELGEVTAARTAADGGGLRRHEQLLRVSERTQNTRIADRRETSVKATTGTLPHTHTPHTQAHTSQRRKAYICLPRSGLQPLWVTKTAVPVSFIAMRPIDPIRTRHMQSSQAGTPTKT